MDEDGYVTGAPEFISEIAVSTVSLALHLKFQVYRRNGVREYMVWRVEDKAIDWFILRGGKYDSLSPDSQGIYRSDVLPGLWLDPAAMIRGDVQTVFQVAQQGLASLEHQARLAKAASLPRD